MDEKRWWLVEGVMVEETYPVFEKQIWKLNKGWIEQIKSGKAKLPIPIGVPFDCMPEWANGIEYIRSGADDTKDRFRYVGDGRASAFIDHKKCPEGLKEGTFEITDELRELLK